MSLSVRQSGYHFDLTSDLKQEAPPYIPENPPTYKLKPHVPRGLHLRAIDGEHSPSLGPDDARLSGFDLAESVWSHDSDLTLDDLALQSDSVSTQSRSTTSSHWSAPPLTPSTSRHSEFQPPLTSALPIAVPPQAEEPLPEEPGSPAPAYSRDPLEFDPVLLASLDSQLRWNPFEAFEDACWASFSDPTPAEVAQFLPPRSDSLPHHHIPTSSASFTVHSTFSDASTATILAPSVPLNTPSLALLPPPAYVASKPLPSLPPASPLRLRAELARPVLPSNLSEDVTSKSPSNEIDYPSLFTAPPGDTVKFTPLRAEGALRPRSKSVGGTKTVQRLTHAIARLRGRE